MTNQITVWSSALISPRACVYFTTNFLCHHEFQVKGDYLRHRWRTWLQFHKARARESFTILPTRTRCVRIPSDWLWEEPLLRCLTWCFWQIAEENFTFHKHHCRCFSVDCSNEGSGCSLSTCGLAIGCITQESSDKERVKVKNGLYQLVLFSPEALLSVCRWRELQGENYGPRIVAFIVDEAHCVKIGKLYIT